MEFALVLIVSLVVSIFQSNAFGMKPFEEALDSQWMPMPNGRLSSSVPRRIAVCEERHSANGFPSQAIWNRTIYLGLLQIDSQVVEDSWKTWSNGLASSARKTAELEPKSLLAADG